MGWGAARGGRAVAGPLGDLLPSPPPTTKPPQPTAPRIARRVWPFWAWGTPKTPPALHPLSQLTAPLVNRVQRREASAGKKLQNLEGRWP